MSCFNPRPHTGSDFFSSQMTMFQSTPPHGERLFKNPRPHTGSDINRVRFQSTPPHGERLTPMRYIAPATYVKSFNPRPHTGSDIISYWMQSTLVADISSFNPRPHTGSDCEIRNDALNFNLVFQSTPPHGERLTE